jgi:Holliday junction resolvase RusA-like endonuclease
MEVPLLNVIKQAIESQFDLENLLFYGRINVSKHVSKKNNRPIFQNRGNRKAFLGKSDDLKAAEDNYLRQLHDLKDDQKIIKPIGSDLWIVCFFYFSEFYIKDGSRRSKRVNDLSNLLELPMDCLQTAGIIEDDSQVCSFDLSRRFPSNDGTNFCEIFILKHKEPER